MDYRNAIKWYQYDPTKWFIAACKVAGLASHLKTFPDNEVRKGQLTMQLKRLREEQENVVWPTDNNDLPVIEWENCKQCHWAVKANCKLTFILFLDQQQCSKRPLILIAGFIHDVGKFIEEHPGGAHLITKFIGKDATTAFFGGVYDHSNAAHNLLAMKRVGILHGGAPHANDDKTLRSDDHTNHSYAYYSSSDIEKTVPPSQRLKIARYTDLVGSGSSGAWSS